MSRPVTVIWLLLLIVPASPASPWSINTHMYSANLIIRDLEENGDHAIQVREVIRGEDGSLSSQPLGAQIAIPEPVAVAILAQKDAFRAGACGPDGFPDIYVGQSLIHPYEPGRPWRAIDWAHHVLATADDWGEDDEEHQKAIAFAAGWLVHYAGDAFGHTWVNSYAGGEWDWGAPDIVKKHVVLEGYVNSKIPQDDEELASIHLEPDAEFIRDCLMMADEVQPSIEPAGYLKALVDYYRAFRNAERKCEDRQEEWWNPVGWGIDAVEDWLEHYRQESENAMREWGETSTVVLQMMAEKKPYDIPGELGEWALEYPARLCPFIPKQIIDVIAWLGHEIAWMMSPVSRLQEEIVHYVYDELLRDAVESMIGAEALMDEIYGTEVKAQVDEQMGVTDDHPSMDWETFAPLYDTVTLGKLVLLDHQGMDQLAALLGVPSFTRGEEDNLLWDCIDSLDASHQLSRYPKFRLLETAELKQNAFRRLFMSEPYEPPPCAIDSAHIGCFLTNIDREVAFLIPVPDPGNDRSRVVGYVYQKLEDSVGERRVPFFEAGIPTQGALGGSVTRIVAKYRAPRYGTYRFHLATAVVPEGSADPLEDQGIDLQVNIQQHETYTGPAPPDLPFDPEQMIEAQKRMAQMMLEGIEQALQNPDLPPETRAQMEEAWQQAQETLDRLNQLDPDQVLPDQQGEEGAAPDDESYSMPPEVVDRWLQMAEHYAAGTLGEDDAEIAAHVAQARLCIGVLTGAEGPVANGTVTLVESSVYEQLRSAQEVPMVRFDHWMPDYETGAGGRYYCAGTNAKGQYMFFGVPDGDYQLIASAAGYPKVERRVTASLGEGMLIRLPDVSLAAEAEEGAGGEGAFRQRVWSPGFTLRVEPSLVNHDSMEPDGGVPLWITLRPLAGFTGPVELSAEGLPEGVRLDFLQNPVPLDRPQEVPAFLRLEGEVTQNALALIRATSGEISREAPVMVCLVGGRLAWEPDDFAVAPGEKAPLRLSWEGAGEMARAARISLPELPQGISVKAEVIRGHPHVEPLRLIGLTVEEAEQARQALRPVAEVPVVPRPQRPPLTVERIQRAPQEAPARGILLAPGGWVELMVAVAAGVEPGTYRIPVRCELGRQVVEEVVELRVTK